jgi:CheY-like chemotaxis protein
VFSKILRSMNYTYDIADNGMQALERIDCATKYDAVLLDWEMPVMDGLTTAKEIQISRGCTVPIVLLSAHSPDSLREILSKSRERIQVVDILAKPLSISQLQLLLQRIAPGSPRSSTSSESDREYS